ncbi:hypothetical protein ACFSYD_08875 [Paracoccus aerius]
MKYLGTAGDDFLYDEWETITDDLFDGGMGNDTIASSGGYDTLVGEQETISSASGTRVMFGKSPLKAAKDLIGSYSSLRIFHWTCPASRFSCHKVSFS